MANKELYIYVYMNVEKKCKSVIKIRQSFSECMVTT